MQLQCASEQDEDEDAAVMQDSVADIPEPASSEHEADDEAVMRNRRQVVGRREPVVEESSESDEEMPLSLPSSIPVDLSAAGDAWGYVSASSSPLLFSEDEAQNELPTLGYGASEDFVMISDEDWFDEDDVSGR